MATTGEYDIESKFSFAEDLPRSIEVPTSLHELEDSVADIFRK